MDCLAQRKKFKNKHPVWEDPNDEKFKKATDVLPSEVPNDDDQDSISSSSSSSDEEDYELVAGEVRSKRLRLETKELRYKHLTNINNDRSFSGGVKQVQFHPTSRIALVTLSKGQVDLYEVDGERNRYIQNIKLPYSKQPYCSFQSDGNSIVISSDNYRGKFYIYDMLSGDIRNYSMMVGRELREITDFIIQNDLMACRLEGSHEIMALSSKTYENAFSLKLNEPAKGVRFSGDHDIFIAGENARVYIWDIRKTTLCKHKFQDEGSIHTKSFDLSDGTRSLSLGSDCGIMNTYNIEDCLASRFPTPIRTYRNLKSDIDILQYNHSGEILMYGASQEKGAFRMTHTLSGTVYRNFPIPNKDYGRLLSACFSPMSGYLALGCSTGRAHLCRIPYFKAY